MVKKKSQKVYGYVIPFFIALFLIVFSAVAIINVWYRKQMIPGSVIVSDLDKLSAIFKRIDQKAQIISFDHQKNWINFLQIKRGGFVGSEVGSMNLAYPDEWEGPYLEDNPMFRGKEYQVVRVKQGYFVMPGEGVKLPNGKILGQDIVINEDTDVFALMKNAEGLMFNGKPLARKILPDR